MSPPPFTIPLATALLYEGSPAAVIANLALWAVVIRLKKQHGKQHQVDTSGADQLGSRGSR